MAYSYVQYTGNGSIKTFSVPFTYISQSHIAVKVNGVLKAAGTDYTWDTPSSITFVTAPGNGLTVDIRRASSPSQRIIDFQDGSTLTQDILDADSNQNFFMAQEAIDAVASNIALASDGVFDAVNKRIKNGADPINAQDFVTKNWAENASSSQVAQATTQANNAATSAANSASSAAASAASATAASGSAGTASTKATDASNSATAAAASASAALTSKNAAATSETNAASSASSASSSATSANTSAVNAATSASGASASASTATTKASDASASATAAANSASAAATSATNASASAASASSSSTTAATQATNAASSATAAAGSATSASTSATTATTKAGEAATSATNAATSATNAASSATSAANSASDANTSAVSAASSAASAAALLDNFDDRYLGAKSSAPSLDNDGNALVLGALYFDSTTGKMRVYTASGWIDASSASVATLATFEFVATAGQTVFTGNDANGASLAYVAPALMVTLNGVRLRPGDDYTATNGTSITLVNAAAVGDELVVDAFGSFLVADTYSKAQADTLLAAKLDSSTATTLLATKQDSSTAVVMTGATGAALLPSGTTAQRPVSPTLGMKRYNTTLGAVEYYGINGWSTVQQMGVPISNASFSWQYPPTVNTSGATVAYNDSNYWGSFFGFPTAGTGLSTLAGYEYPIVGKFSLRSSSNSDAIFQLYGFGNSSASGFWDSDTFFQMGLVWVSPPYASGQTNSFHATTALAAGNGVYFVSKGYGTGTWSFYNGGGNSNGSSQTSTNRESFDTISWTGQPITIVVKRDTDLQNARKIAVYFGDKQVYKWTQMIPAGSNYVGLYIGNGYGSSSSAIWNRDQPKFRYAEYSGAPLLMA